MDSRPLDIRVSSVNSALPCEKTCKTGQRIGDQTLISHLTDTRDTDNDSQQQMGKITSSGLKRTACAKDTSSLMAPQKWSQETLIPSRMDMITSKLGELVQDIQYKGLDINVQKIIGTNVNKGAHHKDISQINVDNGYHYSACDELFNGFTEDAKNLTDVKLERKIETVDVFIYAALVLDHPYALSSCPLLSPSSEDGDVGCDSNSQSGETDQSCQNLSRDCNYPKLGVSEAFPVSALDVNRKLNGFSKSQSPSPSISSSTTDINSKSSHSLLSGDDYSDIGSGINSPGSPSFHNITACPVKPADVDGKFRTRSFSFNNLELGKLLSNRENTTRKRFDSGIPSDHHSNRYNSMHSPPSSSPNIHPLLRSPASDWDRSEADSETQDSSDAKTPHRMSPYFTDKAAEWSHPVFHDHDYYAKSTDFISSAIDFRKCRRGKRNYTVKKKLDRINREKIMNSKYLKKELLRKDNFIKSASGLEPAAADTSVVKSNPVGRPRKRQLDKVVDEIDPETGTKLKITGKFKDQYVYYLSKSSRTTARARHTLTPSSKSDRIIVPATNPGDIVIPHLTDADIEELRLKGCNANTLAEKSQRNASSSTQPLQPFTTSCNASSESVSDVDSHIVSTILSMENDNIGSAEMQETSDIINTSGLNPNQPALTESLRLMSGDSSITSEHVLNYLLCMVKDEGLLAGVRGFDNCHSALLPSDNTRADHAVEPGNTVCEDLSLLGCGLSSGQDLFEDTKSMACTKPFDSQTLHGSEQVQEIDKLGHNNKYFGDEGVNFPDDLSSFLSEPKGTVSSTSNGYSNSLMKSTFECDFNLFGIPQSSSSIHRLTSIEKTLDYLGVPDEDMKLDCCGSDANVNHGNDSSPVTTSSTFADDTPWIVTITLYFNDVPAIMLNNQPHIRLVDIHKQILPAKDTGILKKRCQLLKIPVLCCTEMQRYFLVQYGRAYNSKSTLIVSKDNATDLVTYYATPQPRNARTFETHKSNPEKNTTALNGKLPVDHIPSDVIKRHVIKGSRKTSDLTSLSSKDHQDSPMQLSQKDKLQKTEALTAHSNRTRHKKINYLELLKGEEKEKSSNAAAGAGISLSPDHDKSLKMYVRKTGKMSLPCSDMDDVINRKFTNIHQKKNRQMDGERGKFSRIKKRSKHNQAVEQEVNVCSETDSDGCANLAQSKKCKPLKLKVNTLLNFVRQRTGSSVSKHSLSSCSNSAATTDRSSRVLSVVHQAALADNSTESSLPSQAADIHLDLFVKPNSSCVCCATCSQFLSVPHFMRHHHVPLDDELLSTKATQRVLAPRNKENISQQEQQLWTEFHRLQEAIGGFGEADDETDSDGSEDQCSLDLSNGDHITLKSHETSVSSHQHLERPSLSTPGLSSPSWDSSLTMKDDKNHSFLLYKKLSTISKPASKRRRKLSSEIHTGLAQQSVDTSALSDAELQTYIEPGASNTRTSTRKRKSKQFFSIENYYTPKRWVVGEEFISQKHVRT